MSEQVERVSKWVYTGVWGVLTRWFHVPEHPPALPSYNVESFKPSIGFLKYLKFQFWLGFFFFDIVIGGVELIILFNEPFVGALLFIPAVLLAIVPDIIVYLAIHLRYDTTWYVMSDRSIRIRRGIWIIHETTITFENIQNVTVKQGPLQRWFGIANVSIETAGGGGQSVDGHGTSWQASHCGLIEGVSDAQRIRDLIMSRLDKSKTSGLGDDDDTTKIKPWSKEHVNTLREIRDLIAITS